MDDQSDQNNQNSQNGQGGPVDLSRLQATQPTHTQLQRLYFKYNQQVHSLHMKSTLHQKE